MREIATTAANTTATTAALRAEKALPQVAIALLGALILSITGFVGSTTIHNAAHDVRHAMAFPCH